MRMLAPMNSPIWPPMSPARVGGAGTGRSVVSGHRGSSRAYWDRGRQVIFAKRLTAFVQKEHKAILVGFLFSSLCFSAFFYFSKANRYYSENIKYPNIHSLGKFSQAYEIVPHSCPQACLFHFALSEGSAPSSHYIPRQQSLGKALGGGGVAGEEGTYGTEVGSLLWVVGCRTMPTAWEGDSAMSSSPRSPAIS